nr:hypothetical protein [Tanacetum cinerariifolium]
MESIHVNFDELPQMASAHNSSDPAPTCQKMASVQNSSDPAPECQTMTLEHNSLSPGRKCQENVSHGDKTVKQSQELKTVSYHKLYDILKQYQNEVNEIKAERIARAANPFALVAQQQPVYHPQNHPTHYNQNSSTISQQVVTRNRGKAILNSPHPIYDEEPSMVVDDDEIENQDNSPRINRGAGYDNKRLCNVVGARETVGKDAAYHREKMLLCKQEEAGIQLNAEQADLRDDTDDESKDQELEAHYIEHPKQSKSVHDTYQIEQDENNVIIDSLDMSYDRERIDQYDDDDLANEQSSNNRFKEANNKLSETNTLMYKDLKKSQAELDKPNDVEYTLKVEIDCAN